MQWIDFQQSVEQRLNVNQLDKEQDRAKNLNVNGHALVRGVAGSGKSLVLRSRVGAIIEQFDDILVLSYNRFMNGWIQSKLRAERLLRRVECRTFHSWSYRELGYSYENDRKDNLRKTVIDLAQKSGIKYQAILVDEAQDFYDEWFTALLNVLDTESNSLFFVYDNTQSVYGQPHRRKANWSWLQLGIDVRGRSQIFDINYRNSPEILEAAWQFIQPSLKEAKMRTEKREKNPTIDRIIQPKKKQSRSSKLLPFLQQIDFNDVSGEIARQVKSALKSEPQSSIGILTHPQGMKSLRQEISQELGKLKVRHHAPQSSQERDGNVVDRPYIVVDSWNALKGVEFDAVIIVGVDYVNDDIADPDKHFQEYAGLYTAMTRARDHLVMLYEDENVVTEHLEHVLTSKDILDYAES